MLVVRSCRFQKKSIKKVEKSFRLFEWCTNTQGNPLNHIGLRACRNDVRFAAVRCLRVGEEV